MYLGISDNPRQSTDKWGNSGVLLLQTAVTEATIRLYSVWAVITAQDRYIKICYFDFRSVLIGLLNLGVTKNVYLKLYSQLEVKRLR